MADDHIVMRQKRVMVRSENELFEVDAIPYAGKLWMVTEWQEAEEGAPLRPAIMIRFDHLRHQAALPVADYVVNETVPAAALCGEPTHGVEALFHPAGLTVEFLDDAPLQ